MIVCVYVYIYEREIGGRKRGGQRKEWEHNVAEWSNLSSS